MKFHYTLIFALLFIGLFDACRKQDEYPIEPVIEMSVKQIYQNPSVIVISFTDGDGDVGFNGSTYYETPNLDGGIACPTRLACSPKT